MRFGRREQVTSQSSARSLRWIAVVALAAALASPAAMTRASAEAEQRIDINRASVEELMSLPGVGPAKAQAIVEHRKTAPFKKTEELLEVRGIGDSIYADLRDRITVSESAAEPAGTQPPAVTADRN
jgi:competence protein ComEA